jgi:hypothetical protein
VIRYRDGYRFQLAEPAVIPTPVRESCPGNSFVMLTADGRLVIAAGYAWDGASGPIPQDSTVMRGSLVHDALYQLMRECGLSVRWKAEADALLKRMCIADGMPAWQAWIVHAAVRVFGGRYLDSGSRKPVLSAP